MKKILISILCLFCCVSLVACNFGKKDEQTSNETEKSLTLISNGVSSYSMIYPSSSTGEDMVAVLDFQDLFLNRTSVSLESSDDFLKAGEMREETYKILVGQTDYSLSRTAYEGLRYHDFRILTDETCIAIAAYSKEGYSAALQWLEQNVISSYSNGVLKMGSTDVTQSVIKEYPISKWTIGGNELKNYKIVYADGIDRTQILLLRNEIAKKSGWFLEVDSDKDAAPEPYEILIGDTNRAETAAVEAPALNYVAKTVNGKLVVKWGGWHSYELLIKDLSSVVIPDMNKVIMGEDYETFGDFYDDPNNVQKAKDANIRIMDANVLAQLKDYNDIEAGFAFDRRLEIFFSALDFYDPTVVGLQEFCKNWYEGIQRYQNIDKWEILKFQNPNLSSEFVLSTIMYRKDLLTLVDSGMTYYSAFNNGRCRCITWAVLRDNATGKDFCFVSTHWDGGNGEIDGETENTWVQVNELSAFVKEMAEKYPVFTTGDFNRNEYTNAFKTYLSNINSVDAMYGAQQRLNKLGSYHGWGKDTPSAGSCDHITATKDVTVLKFETLVYNQQIYASDHAWLMADIKFN